MATVKDTTTGGLRRISRCFDLVGLEREVASNVFSAASRVEAFRERTSKEEGTKIVGLPRVPRCFDLVGLNRSMDLAELSIEAAQDEMILEARGPQTFGAAGRGLRRVPRSFDLVSMACC